MLHTWTIQCTHTGRERAHPSWGSVLHGALMEWLSPGAGSLLHEQQLRPFAQYVHDAQGNQFTWRINAWDDAVAAQIAGALVNRQPFTLRQKNIEVSLVSSAHSAISEAAFAQPFFAEEAPSRLIDLRFLTPCTHKTDGAYALFPSPWLIVQSLSRKLSAFSQVVSLEDETALEALARDMRIARYRLQSAPFSLEQTRVAGYVGSLRLYLGGRDQLARLGAMTLMFANYAGVGIKTALGMGGCEAAPAAPSAPRSAEQSSGQDRPSPP